MVRIEEKDWTKHFFLAHPEEAGEDGSPPAVHLLEVRGLKEVACLSLTLPAAPADEAEEAVEQARLGLAGFMRGKQATILTHDLSLLDGVIPCEAFPSSARWLEGYELALLLFPRNVEYSLARLAQDPEEDEDQDLLPTGLDGARLYLCLLERWHDRVERIDSSLRSQVAALLLTSGDPLAWFFSPRPGRVRPLAFSERAPRRRAREGRLGPEAGEQVDPGELDRYLASDGLFHKRDDCFEVRPEQQAMAREVLDAFNQDAFLVVEAGTGVGKSMAYLLPAALFSLAGQTRVVISTHTKSLQDQLFGRDLPRLASGLSSLRYCRLKGRSNYLCLKRWEDWCSHQSANGAGEGRLGFGGIHPLRAWAALLLYLDGTSEGDLEELSLEVRERLRETLTSVCSQPEECLGPACPLRERCWVEAARDRAGACHVVVVNHALLLSDAAETQVNEEGAAHPVLPAYARLVVDEAHHLERVATEIFSAELSLGTGLNFIDRLEAGRGLLQRSEAFFSGTCKEGLTGQADPAFTLLRDLREELSQLRERLSEFFITRLPVLSGDGKGRRGAADQDSKTRVTWQVVNLPAWEELERSGDALAGCLEDISGKLADLGKLANGLAGEKGLPEDERKSLEARSVRLAERCTGHADTVRQFFREEPQGELPERLRWWEMAPRWRYRGATLPNGRICMAPVDIGPLVQDKLLTPLESAVFTSATLRAGEGDDGFAYFTACSGLDQAAREEREVKFKTLGSPFDYAGQARCLVVTDLPEPRSSQESDARYLEGLSGVIGEALTASRGRALVLFTSYRVLERVAGELFPILEERGITCLRQERDSSNIQLLGRFREEVGSALFATSSFWEGVDIPGESLSLVIITKLPFSYFGDPLMEGRMEFIKATGRGDGWREYYLPRAVMQFRQGLGRLIRRASDRGVMLVLDPRMTRRNYSRLFLAALPAGLPVQEVEAAGVGRLIHDFLSPR